MTWNQFKEAVDRWLEQNGNDSSVPIWYIDISFPHAVDNLEFGVDSDSGFFIYT